MQSFKFIVIKVPLVEIINGERYLFFFFLEIVDSENTNWHLWWCDTGDVLRQALDGDQKKLRPYQRVPHFRNHYELTRKNYLYRNLKRYRKALIRAGKIAEARISDVMPVTFELPSDYLMFVEEYHK